MSRSLLTSVRIEAAISTVIPWDEWWEGDRAALIAALYPSHCGPQEKREAEALVRLLFGRAVGYFAPSPPVDPELADLLRRRLAAHAVPGGGAHLLEQVEGFDPIRSLRSAMLPE